MQADSPTSSPNPESGSPATPLEAQNTGSNHRRDHVMLLRLLGKYFQKYHKFGEGIQKTEDCDRMTCTCGQHSCHICGEDWNGHQCAGANKTIGNVDFDFLQICHNPFLRLGTKNGIFTEHMSELNQQPVNGLGQREENHAKMIEELLNILHWCHENLKWS
jgi:hypothetical protein